MYALILVLIDTEIGFNLERNRQIRGALSACLRGIGRT